MVEEKEVRDSLLREMIPQAAATPLDGYLRQPLPKLPPEKCATSPKNLSKEDGVINVKDKEEAVLLDASNDERLEAVIQPQLYNYVCL